MLSLVNASQDDNLSKEINKYLTSCKAEGLSDQSIRIYEVSLDYFHWWCKYEAKLILDPKIITQDDIIGYIAYLKTPQKTRWGRKIKANQEKLSMASVNTYFRCLRVFFNHLELKEVVVKSPIRRNMRVTSKKEPLPTRYEKNLDTAQLTKLFDYLGQPDLVRRYNGCRNLAIVSLLLDSGMRRGELLSIKVGDFDWENKTVKINGKTGPRLCLFKGAEQALIEYRDRFRKRQEIHKSENSPFWLTSDDQPLSINGIQTLMHNLARDSGVKFSAHRLRHTFASFMVQRVSIYDVSKLLGHSNISTTEGYTSSSANRMQEIYKNNSPLTAMELGPARVKPKRGRPPGAKNLRKRLDE